MVKENFVDSSSIADLRIRDALMFVFSWCLRVSEIENVRAAVVAMGGHIVVRSAEDGHALTIRILQSKTGKSGQ